MTGFIKLLAVLFILFESTTGSYTCSSIEKEDENTFPKSGDFYAFTIPQGSHESYTNLTKLQGENLSFSVKFDSTAIYSLSDLKDSTNIGDIHKLFGFNDCGMVVYNHTHSARFGWRYYYGELQLFSYCYSNRENTSKFLKSININDTYKLEINIVGSTYEFYIDDKLYDTAVRGCTTGDEVKYLLYPYFGGDELAPHDINIYIKTDIALK